ncbi:alpha-1-antitrypsin-like, partial [Arapaima gigas]
MKLLLCLCIVLLVLCTSLQGNRQKEGEDKEHGRGQKFGHEQGRGQKFGHEQGHGQKFGHEQGRGQKFGHEQGRGQKYGHEQGQGHKQEQGHKHDHDQGHHQHGRQKNGSLDIFMENVDFAFRLYKQIVSLPESQTENVFFSPLSVSLALAALSLGARGQTHEQLLRGLGFNKTEITAEEVNEAFHQILLELNNKTDVDLSVGSALFMRNTFKPHPEFLDNMKRYYLSEGFTANFSKTADTIELINSYVKNKTHGKIPRLVQDLDPRTIMYLISYMYFK